MNETFSSIFTNAQLLNSNCLNFQFKIGFLNQVVNINDNDLSKSKLITSLEADFDQKYTCFSMI